MELALFVYLAGVVENISYAGGALLLIGALPLLVINMINYQNARGEDSERQAINFSIKSGILYVLAWFVLCFIPSKTTMYTMVGAYAGQQIALAPETSEIMSKTLKIINKKLDEELK